MATKLLLYFSGTGNSLALAKDLQKKLEGYEIRAITDIVRAGEIIEAEEIGIVTPVYMFSAPHIVLKALKLIRADFIFAVANNGGGPGRTLVQINSKLKKQNQKLTLGVEIRMPDNYLPFGGKPSDEKIAEYFAEAEKKIAFTVDAVKNRSAHYDKKTPWWQIYLMPGPFYWMGYVLVKWLDLGFTLNRKKCTGCTICETVCPVNNISMKEKTPKWKQACEQCYACIQWCPTKAIDYVGPMTRGKERYQHPQITLAEIKQQAGA